MYSAEAAPSSSLVYIEALGRRGGGKKLLFYFLCLGQGGERRGSWGKWIVCSKDGEVDAAQERGRKEMVKSCRGNGVEDDQLGVLLKGTQA
jgi:hypothetical protein